MSRIAPVVPEDVDAATGSTLTQLKVKLGKVPNGLATLAHSAVALEGYLALSKILSRGRLNARQREIVALAIAQANECQYCLSFHTASSTKAGLSPVDILDARAAQNDDPFEHAVAAFAVKVVQLRGLVPETDFAAARQSGLDHDLMLEIVANVALQTLMNYSNRLADTDIDFPVVQVQL